MSDTEILRNASRVLVRELAIGPAEAAELCEELGWFFRAVVSEKMPLTPSRRVDEAWHALLSEPGNYAEFCVATCGVPVRHIPGQPTPADYQRTLSAMGRLRGGWPAPYWPELPADGLSAECHGGGNPAPAPCTATAATSATTATSATRATNATAATSAPAPWPPRRR